MCLPLPQDMMALDGVQLKYECVDYLGKICTLIYMCTYSINCIRSNNDMYKLGVL